MGIVLKLMLLTATVLQTSVAGVVKENKSEDKDVKRSGYNPGTNGESGFNPGNSNGGNGQSGYNPGYNGGGGNNPGNGGASGYNPGQGGVTGGSGFYPGNNGGVGYKPGGEKPSNDESNGWTGGSDNSGGAGYKPGHEEPSNGGSNGWTGGSGGVTGGSGDQIPHIPDFNPGNSNGGNGQSGYNPGYNGGGGNNPGNGGASGYNPGQGGSGGYKPGGEKPSNDESNGWTGGSDNSGSSGYRPGHEEPSNGGSNGWTGGSGGVTGGSGDQIPHIPDFTPGAGQSGYNPGQSGYHPGSQKPSSPDEIVIFPENGYNPGATEGSGSNPRKSGGRKALPRKRTQFRTPIIFADEEDDEKAESKRPEERKETSETKKQTKPVSGNSLPTPIVYLLQPVGTSSVYNPQLLVSNPSTAISAQTLPSPVQFFQEEPKQPYMPGQSKQQYLKPIEDTFTPSNFLLRPVGLTEPFLAESRDSLPPQAVPSPGPLVGVSHTGYNPQLLVSNPSAGLSVQTLPSPIQFAQAVHYEQPYMPGHSKQQYLRGGQSSGQYQQEENIVNKFAPLNLFRQTRPFLAAQQIPKSLQYFDENHTTHVKSEPQTSRAAGDDFLPGASTRPRYPPGYSQSPALPPSSGYAGPKTVLYIF